MKPMFDCRIESTYSENEKERTIVTDFHSLNILQLKVTQKKGVGYKGSDSFDISITDQGCTVMEGNWGINQKRKRLGNGMLHTWDEAGLSLNFSGFTEFTTFSALFYCLQKILVMMKEDHCVESIACVVDTCGLYFPEEHVN